MSSGTEPDLDLSPVGALSLLWPGMPDVLVDAEARSRLDAAAAGLVPIARVALELRLDEDDRIDLHQFVTRSAADAVVLKRHLACAGAAAPTDETLRRFLDAWVEDADGVRTDLSGFFLEWDRPGASDATAPAVFLPVEGRHDHDDGAGRERVVRHIGRLGPGGGHAAGILRAIPGSLSVAHIGFMLGRGHAVRINLRGIRPDDLAGVLGELRWPGDIRRASERFALLVGLTDRVAVALDFAPSLQPTIGFEASLPADPAHEPRWSTLLDGLCAEGLCTAEKRQALERVGGRLYPEDEGQD